MLHHLRLHTQVQDLSVNPLDDTIRVSDKESQNYEHPFLDL